MTVNLALMATIALAQTSLTIRTIHAHWVHFVSQVKFLVALVAPMVVTLVQCHWKTVTNVQLAIIVHL
jgi:hypothetical protein